MPVVLPDCRDLQDIFFLNPEQRRELLLLLAEKGEAGLEEFIRRHESDDTNIARRLRKVKDRLMEEAAELRRRLYSQYDEKRRSERERHENLLERLRKEEKRIAEQEAQLS